MNEISTALKTLTDKITVKLEIGEKWKSHSTLPLLATQNYPFWLKYD